MGSCFAQHIAKHFTVHGYRVVNAEPAPEGLDAETAKKFGYGVYSARYGNLYTTRQLLQLTLESLGAATPQHAAALLPANPSPQVLPKAAVHRNSGRLSPTR